VIDTLGLDGVSLVGHSMGTGEVTRYLVDALALRREPGPRPVQVAGEDREMPVGRVPLREVADVGDDRELKFAGLPVAAELALTPRS
jgi:pimeloyl-ACP methyl ester carboxylesterase